MKIIISLMFFVTAYSSVFASFYCSKCVYKVTCYGISGSVYTGYIQHVCDDAGSSYNYGIRNMMYNSFDEYENYRPRIQARYINWNAIPVEIDTSKGIKILCADTTLLTSNFSVLDPNEYTIYQVHDGPYLDMLQGHSDSSIAKVIAPEYHILSIQDSLVYYTLHQFGEDDNIFFDFIRDNNEYRLAYAEASYINFDTLLLVTVDSILWCADMFQLHWLTADMFRIFQTKPVQHIWKIRTYDDIWWIEFVSFDAAFTHEQFLKYVDINLLYEQLEKHDYNYSVFSEFHPEIQKAITSNTMFYAIRYSP